MIEGPKWVPYTEESEGQRRIPMPPCAACTELALVDKETGLCRNCWRVWRFAASAVCPDCIQPAGQPHGYRCVRARMHGSPMLENP